MMLVCFILQHESCSFDVFFSVKLYRTTYRNVINSSAEAGRANHAQEGVSGVVFEQLKGCHLPLHVKQQRAGEM